jgi:hypothetical protein
MAADKTLIEGARRVAETKATAAMGAQAFQKGLQAAKPKQSVAQKLSAALDKRDAEVKQTNAELKKFYENRSVLDQSAVTDPRYQGTFGNKLKEWKTVYNDGASQAVKNREDVQSEGYQQGVDAMNGRNQAIQRLTTQVQKFDRLKSEFNEIIKGEGLSLGIPEKKRAQVMAIFKDDTGAAMEIDDDGFITFKLTDGSSIKLDDFEMPEPKNTAFRDAVAARSAAISQGKEVITPEAAASNKNAYEKLLDTEEAITSGLADYRGEFENQFDAIESKLEAGKDDEGNPYDVFAARDEMIDLLVQGEVTLSKEYNRKATQTKDFKYGTQLKQLEELGKGEASNASVTVGTYIISWLGPEKGYRVITKTGRKAGEEYKNYDELYNSIDELQKRVTTS